MHGNQVAWRCRRGMVELDVLLYKFYHQVYHRLADTAKQDFQALLEFPDPTLLAWLTGQEKPNEAHLQAIVAEIQSFAQSV